MLCRLMSLVGVVVDVMDAGEAALLLLRVGLGDDAHRLIEDNERDDPPEPSTILNTR